MMLDINNLHSMPCLLPGDVSSGQAFILRGDLNPMAAKKLNNFKEYQTLYPEFAHVFIGDNGQADVKAAEDMCQLSSAVECGMTCNFCEWLDFASSVHPQSPTRILDLWVHTRCVL